MTSQDKKDELNKYREAEAQATRLRNEISRLYSIAEKTTTTLSLIPGGGEGGNKIETAIEAIDELASQAGEKQLGAVQQRRRIEDAIAGVPDWKLRMLLRYRYIDGMKWEQIAENMGFDRRHVTRLHGKALAAIQIESCP